MILLAEGPAGPAPRSLCLGRQTPLSPVGGDDLVAEAEGGRGRRRDHGGSLSHTLTHAAPETMHPPQPCTPNPYTCVPPRLSRRRLSRVGTPHVPPQTPNPNSKTPNPKPQTPNSKPQTPNPKPQTPNPKPQTPNPKPQTSNPNPRSQPPNPKPRTPNPRPQTPNPKPQIPNPGPKPGSARYLEKKSSGDHGAPETPRSGISCHRMCLSNGFRKSTLPQNCECVVYYYL